jgi:hypothetical protein
MLSPDLATCWLGIALFRSVSFCIARIVWHRRDWFPLLCTECITWQFYVQVSAVPGLRVQTHCGCNCFCILYKASSRTDCFRERNDSAWVLAAADSDRIFIQCLRLKVRHFLQDRMCVCVCACVSVSLRVCVRLRVYLYVCVSVCLCICFSTGAAKREKLLCCVRHTVSVQCPDTLPNFCHSCAFPLFKL